jgi:hypothetical protein
MGNWGLGMGEATSLGGLIFKLIKTIAIFSAVFGVVILETHLFGFGITNLFVNEYNFQLQDMKSDYIIHGYNNFLYSFSRMAVKLPTMANFAIILIVPSLVYASFFHSKRKKFPGVIIGTVINNTIAFLIIGLLVQLSFKVIGLYAIGLYSLPVFYTVYLIKYKTEGKKNKFEKFEVVKESEKEESFVFSTNKGKISLDNPYRGIYIQGGAGSGKSASIFEPIIQQIGQKEYSGILYDHKSPELTEKVYLSYQNTSIKVKNVDFKQPLLSDRVNPIDPKYLTKSAIAMEYAQVIINNL